MNDQGSDPKFVVVDIETSGLNPEIDLIFEIGVIICDLNLKELGRQSHVLGYSNLPFMEDFVRQMHTESDLLSEVLNSTKTLIDVEQSLYDFIISLSADGNPMCGSSIHFDRAFIREYLPKLESLFHYRNIDISTMKGLTELWKPSIANKSPKGRKIHRSLPDCEDSINELLFYKGVFFL